MSKLFKTSLFGYRKKDVTAYVEKISGDFTAQIEDCKKEIEKLQSQRESLEKKRAEIEKEKASISEAIISAHEKGEKIIAEAREKAELQMRDMRNKLASENDKLVKIRREVHNIRRNAIKTLSNLDASDDEE